MKNFFPIEELVKKIFFEIYGVEVDELCKKIRDSVKELRLSYQSNVCVTDYNAEENRKAYMISYYPYFIAPASYVAEICLKQNLPESDGKWVFFACGPCPELLGIAQILPPPLSVITLDSEQNWFPYQQITNKFCRDFGLKSRLKFWYGFEIGNSLPTGINFGTRIEFRVANIFFMQNYLSHLSPTDENINKFLTWFSAWGNEAKDGALFVFIDLNYGSTNGSLIGSATKIFCGKTV